MLITTCTVQSAYTNYVKYYNILGLTSVIEKKAVVGKEINMHGATYAYFILATVEHYQRNEALFLFCNNVK